MKKILLVLGLLFTLMTTLYAGISQSSTKLIIKGVMYLPAPDRSPDTDAYVLTVGGTGLGEFPSGVRYFDGTYSPYDTVRNGNVTLTIPDNYCDSGPIVIKGANSDYRRVWKGKVKCGRTTVIRIR